MSEVPPHRIITEKRRNLPHWITEEGTYFVTFRLADALPYQLARRIVKRRKYHRLADRLLDRGFGACHMLDAHIAQIVGDAIEFFDGDRYRLHAYAVMPNHAHAVFRAFSGFDQLKISGSWKSYTAREINRLLGRSGSLWQDEPYDSIVHDQRQLDSVIEYVVRNPVRAHLVNWPWVKVFDRQFRLSGT